MSHRFCWIWYKDVGLWSMLKDRPSQIYAAQSRLSRRCTSQTPTSSAPLQKTLDTLITTPHFVFEYVLHRLLSNGTRTPVVEGVVSSSIFDSYVRHIKVISVMLGLILVIVLFRLFKMTSYIARQIKVFVYHVNQKLLHTITHEQPSWYLGH